MTSPFSPVDSIAPTGKVGALIQGINAQAQNGSGWLLVSEESQLLLAEVQRLQALARQAEAMKREMAELREVRANGRDAAGALHDALMVERAANAELRQSLSEILETAEQYWANPGEISEIVRARALIGGGNAED